MVLVVVLAVWVAARVVFFEGFCGQDDFHHLRYAVFWDHMPQDHWETRLAYNAVLRACLLTFGYGEISAALPGLAGSLMLLGSGLWLAWRQWHCPRRLLLAGLLLALLPMDVLFCTTPTAKPLATGLMALGMALLLGGTRSRSALLAGACLGLATWTHLSMLFPAAILVGTTAVLRHRSWRHGLAAMAMMAGVFALVELGIYALWTGDPLYEFRIASRILTINADNPDNARRLWVAGHLNGAFFWEPVRDLIFSKTFGVLGLLTVGVGLATWRRRGARVMVLACLSTWLWMSYGSQTPTHYTPFAGTTIFWYPLGLPFVLVVVELLGDLHRRWASGLAAGGVLALNLGLMLLSGSWGQSVVISRELLVQVSARRDAVFVTDSRTYTEMYVLNGFHPIGNVRVAPGSPGPWFGDPLRIPADGTGPEDMLVLLNPLNVAEDTATARWVCQHSGAAVYAGTIRYRMIAWLAPDRLRQNWSWAVRKPPAQVCCWQAAPAQH